MGETTRRAPLETRTDPSVFGAMSKYHPWQGLRDLQAGRPIEADRHGGKRDSGRAQEVRLRISTGSILVMGVASKSRSKLTRRIEYRSTAAT